MADNLILVGESQMLAPLSTTQSLTGLDRHHLAWLRGIYYVESDKHTLQISREENEPICRNSPHSLSVEQIQRQCERRCHTLSHWASNAPWSCTRVNKRKTYMLLVGNILA